MGATLYTQTIGTPLGDMLAVAAVLDDMAVDPGRGGIALFDFADNAHLPREIDDLCRLLGTTPATIQTGKHPYLTQLAEEIREYFEGGRREFSVPLLPVGTAFQLQVWDALRRIPYGQTCSYAEEARIMGRPEAVRAVASANGRNKLPILIPCHRVIGTDGTLTGYSGGIQRKIALLDLERQFLISK